VTPGHPLFEALRRNAAMQAESIFCKGSCFYSLQHEAPARIDFYRARVVDGLGNVIHERLFAVQLTESKEPQLQDPNWLGNFTPTSKPATLPPIADAPEAVNWLNANALAPFLNEVLAERLTEIDRIAAHIELSLTELLQKTDEEIGKAAADVDASLPGAPGRLAQAEERHAKLLSKRETRRVELQRQRALTLQSVERLTSILVLPHPERNAPEVRRLRPNYETEATAMRVVIEHEQSQGRQVEDVHEKNLGYDITSLDLKSGDLRLIEIKGLGAIAGCVLLTPNERRVAEDRRDCYWLYVVTSCDTQPELQTPIKDPARFPWHEVKKVEHYWLEVDAMTQPMQLRDSEPRPYGTPPKP